MLLVWKKKTDEELAEEKLDEANKVGLLNKSEWVMIRDRENALNF